MVSHWLQLKTDQPFIPNLDKFGFVYLITNTKTEKAYVGCKQYYIGKAKKESKWQTYMGSSKYLKDDIKKIGKKHFKFEVIAEYINKRSLRYYEAHYQMKWDVLTAVIEGTDEPAFYNSYVGGKFYRPVESYQDPEFKRKISEAHKGKKVTEETRKKQSESHKGKKFTEETKKNMSEAHLGRVHSEEARKKMSEAHKGKKMSEEAKKNMSKPRSEEHKKNISKAKLGVPMSEEHKRKLRASWVERKRKEETNGN